jgi:hypothetical protein
MDVTDIGLHGMNWIDLVQDRDQWRALVNTVMNVRLTGSFRVAAHLAASQDGLSSIEFVGLNMSVLSTSFLIWIVVF